MNGEGQEVSVDFAAAMLAAQMKTATEAARLYPRDEKAARKKLLKLCRDPRFAEQATFTVEQGGELIYRPSINFARPAADAWGHLHTGSRIIRTAHDEEHIEAWAFDAQSIRTVTQPGLVRKIVKRKDPETRREVWVRLEGADLIAARHREVSIVVRRAILDLLPSRLVEDAMRACELAIEKSARKEFESGPIVPLADLLEGWWSQGVREEHLVRYCGKPLAELKPAEIAKLSGMLRGVREGSISVAPFLRSPEVEVVQPPEVVTTPKAAPIEHVEPPAPARPLSPPAPARPITPDDLSDDAWGASPSPIEVPAKDVPF